MEIPNEAERLKLAGAKSAKRVAEWEQDGVWRDPARRCKCGLGAQPGTPFPDGTRVCTICKEVHSGPVRGPEKWASTHYVPYDSPLATERRAFWREVWLAAAQRPPLMWASDDGTVGNYPEQLTPAEAADAALAEFDKRFAK